MILLNLRTFLNRVLNRNERKDSDNAPLLSEQSRLLHRLNCIHLNDEEAKCLQAYLTTILECRHQDKMANAATDSSNCIVLEMAEEELQRFASYVGGTGIRLFL
ncbi:MAG: GAF domain-containing protein, partial [Microcoleus sp. SIO2G3]|nr:GAF domain-containing protein [Microcoleus sp. SIO2G3]